MSPVLTPTTNPIGERLALLLLMGVAGQCCLPTSHILASSGLVKNRMSSAEVGHRLPLGEVGIFVPGGGGRKLEVVGESVMLQPDQSDRRYLL